MTMEARIPIFHSRRISVSRNVVVVVVVMMGIILLRRSESLLTTMARHNIMFLRKRSIVIDS